MLLLKVQTAINDVYKSFNTTQFPFVVANLNLPLGQFIIINASLPRLTNPCLDAYDVNVSPDKLSIFLHHELNLTLALKASILSLLFCCQSSHTTVQGRARGGILPITINF